MRSGDAARGGLKIDRASFFINKVIFDGHTACLHECTVEHIPSVVSPTSLN
jgi:hypothetical protein